MPEKETVDFLDDKNFQSIFETGKDLSGKQISPDEFLEVIANVTLEYGKKMREEGFGGAREVIIPSFGKLENSRWKYKNIDEFEEKRGKE